MSPEDFSDALAAIGWSMNETARRLGCNHVMVQRWAGGLAEVPPSIAYWLLELVEFHSQHPAPKWRTKGGV